MDSRLQNPFPEESAARQTSQQPQEKVSGGFTALKQSYLTPPTDVHHSFSSDDNSEALSAARNKNRLPPLQQRSPPVSPETTVLPSIHSLASGPASQSTDPQLYPDEPSYATDTHAPLFPSDHTSSRVVASSSSSAPVGASSSSTISFAQRTNAIKTPDEAVAYYGECMAGLEAIRDARMAMQLPDPNATELRAGVKRLNLRDAVSQTQLDSLNHPKAVAGPSRVVKTRAEPKPSRRAKAALNSTASEATVRRRGTPKPRSHADFLNSAFPTTQQQGKHTRAPPSKKVENDNVHWSQLPDYAPPTSSLDTSTAHLQAIWPSNNPLELHNDPDREHLHAQELKVASVLRLDCATYLSNKRKIFAGRVKALNEGKNFTKTAAQSACSIDVNKASRLWAAFNNVGWFEESWFQQFLDVNKA